MAKKIETQLRPLGRHKYPWDEWSDGSAWLLLDGEDYTISSASMRRAAHFHARRTGKLVACKTTDEGLIVQFFPVKKLKKLVPPKG